MICVLAFEKGAVRLRRVLCRVFLVVALLLAAISPQGFAASVVVTGQGGSKDAALHDAMRRAIESELGVQVDARTRMENAQIVRDEIVTRSSGFIDGYEVLETAEHYGMHSVKIRAEVASDRIRRIVREKMARRALIDANLADLRLAVLTTDWEGNALPYVEEAMFRQLEGAGFTHVIHMATEEEATRRRTLATGESAQAFLRAMRFAPQAEMYLIARAFPQPAAYGVRPNISHMELAIVDAATGEIRFLRNFPGRISAFSAKYAAEQAVKFLLQEAARPEKNLRVVVTRGILGTPLEAQAKLAGIGGVRRVFLRHAAGDTLTLDLRYDGTAANLAEEIERLGIRVQVMEGSYLQI